MIDSGVESKMGKNNKSIYYYSTVFVGLTLTGRNQVRGTNCIISICRSNSLKQKHGPNPSNCFPQDLISQNTKNKK